MPLTVTGEFSPTDDQTVLFQRVFVDYLDGDILTALMLSQIYYWYRPDKKGKSKLRSFKRGLWWIAKSNAEWQRELGFTPDQVRRSLKVLVDRGLVITEVMTFNRAPTNHSRLAALNGSNEVLYDPKRVLIWDFKEGHLGFNGGYPVENPKSITETTTESTTGEIASQSDSPIEKETGEMATLNDILKKQAESKATLQSGMEVEWGKRMSAQYGGFQPSMTMKEKGQLKQLRMAAEKAGNVGPVVLRWVIENWTSVASEVCARVGLEKAPSMPHVGWVCMYAQHMVDIYKQAHEVGSSASEPVQSIAKPAPVVKVAQVEKEEGPSEAEIADLFAVLKAGKGTSGG